MDTHTIQALQALGDGFRQFARNGRWGTCAGCPRDLQGNAYPEFCGFTGRFDHHLSASELASVWNRDFTPPAERPMPPAERPTPITDAVIMGLRKSAASESTARDTMTGLACNLERQLAEACEQLAEARRENDTHMKATARSPEPNPISFSSNLTTMATQLQTGAAPALLTGPASGILAEIEAELARATIKFPTWPTDALHAVGVIAEEMGELQKEVMQLTYEPHKSTHETVRAEAVQLAAMSIRFLMSLDKYTYNPGPQHSQLNA